MLLLLLVPKKHFAIFFSDTIAVTDTQNETIRPQEMTTARQDARRPLRSSKRRYIFFN